MSDIDGTEQPLSILETPQLMGSLEKVTFWIKKYIINQQRNYEWQAAEGDGPTLLIHGPVEFSPSNDLTGYSSTINFLVRNEAPQKGRSKLAVFVCIREDGRGARVQIRYPNPLSGFVGDTITALMVRFPKVESFTKTDEKRKAVGGRPHDEGYDRAYEFLCSGGTYVQAFKQFCDDNGIRKPDKTTRDGFKGAMKRRGYTPDTTEDT